jgi:hypothetical protein
MSGLRAYAIFRGAAQEACVGKRMRKTNAENNVGKEKGPDESDPFSLMLAERTGLEPATPGVTGRYSNQLNYRSVFTDRFFDKTESGGR